MKEEIQKIISELREKFDDKHSIGWYQPSFDMWLTERLEKLVLELEEQKYYELSMRSQAIDFFLSKDEEDYGTTPLHGKLRAFMDKYIHSSSPSLPT